MHETEQLLAATRREPATEFVVNCATGTHGALAQRAYDLAYAQQVAGPDEHGHAPQDLPTVAAVLGQAAHIAQFDSLAAEVTAMSTAQLEARRDYLRWMYPGDCADERRSISLELEARRAACVTGVISVDSLP